MTETLLTFVHISDTHIHPDPAYTGAHGEYASLEGARQLVRQINALPFAPDFVLHSGDVAYDPVPDAYPACHDILSQIRWPVYYLAGNHDHAEVLQRQMMGWKTVFLPFDYEFEVNGVQVVCVDSNGPAEPPRGFVTEAQLQRLERICDCPDSRPLIVAIHHNVLPVGVPWLDEYMRITNGEEVHRILVKARNRLRGVFFGHVHQNIEMLRDGILYSSVLSSWVQFHSWPGMEETNPDAHAEPGFNVVSLTRDQTFIRRCRFSMETG